jgi:hypothetical protein
MSAIANRVWGAAWLNSRSYEEIEADRQANGQAIAVVFLSSLAGAVGTGVLDPVYIAAMVAAMFGAWLVWSWLVLIIGARPLKESGTEADIGQIMRTTGFSASPGLLRVFGLIPGIGWIIFAAATVWMLVSFVVAVRQSLDYKSAPRALVVCLIGWAISAAWLVGFVMPAQ